MKLGFGNRTIPKIALGTPGFASPPHDGFAFIGAAPEERRKNANQWVQSTQVPNVSIYLLATRVCTILAA
jgi:hypothetical protein